MNVREVIQSLIDQPRESLAVELKDWIDLRAPEGSAKLAKTCIALRNFNGGYLVIGISDDGKPNSAGAPRDVEASFHVDKVQPIVTKYASEPFEVTVHFPERDGDRYPVLEVPSGLTVPVATKADLYASDGTRLIQKDCIYVRSLNANNMPSTTIAGSKDWKDLVERCFDNREADIARFIRRHLANVSVVAAQQLLPNLTKASEQSQETTDGPSQFLAYCRKRFESRKIDVPKSWGTWEVAAIVKGDVPHHTANKRFLQLIHSSNPRYTGWPVWLDTRGFSAGSNPQVLDGGWEALLFIPAHRGVDYWRIEPTGRFYMLRNLQDDTDREPPGKELDLDLVIWRTAEAMAVALRFTKAIGCIPESTCVEFGFRWTKLAGRKLAAWANPRRFIGTPKVASQNIVYSEVVVPLDAPESALGGYVHKATTPLFNVFEGEEFEPKITEDITAKLLRR